jgi:citronellol/citronellal dehydrogenase
MPSKLFKPGLLEGQVAVVSGGGSGLGRASALELAALGARVVVCGRRVAPRGGARGAAGPPPHGRIDLLVNNAGGQYMTPAEDITPKGFSTVMRLNVEGTWLMTHSVATKAMMGGPDAEPRGGKIVNVTLSPHHGLPGMAHSSAARAAVENLTRVLSIEWARFGIRLTALAAGHFATETLRTKYPKQVVEGVAGTVPLGRLGTEEEFAWLVAYLATPAGDYFSGAVLTIDGARDNWFGSWPPGGLADDAGRPLAEERKPKS